MIRLGLVIVAGVVMCGAQAASAKSFDEMFPNAKVENAEAKTLVDSFDYQQGAINLPGLGIKLNIPADYYYFGEADSKRMLTQVWGNPPDTASNVRGMILPASKTPIDDAWAAVLTFDDDGYVSDEDAKKMDYGALLKTMQEGAEEANAERVKGGYGSIKLVGWASPPFYDPASHKMHWAKEIEFDGKQPHTLNYNVRALGRHGVLATNFVADMSQLEQIEKVIPAVMAMPEFQQGFRYADYVPSTDKLAAYGIGGLVAGKVAAKLGLLAGLLLFAKKGLVFVLIAAAAVWNGIKRMFFGGGTKKTEE